MNRNFSPSIIRIAPNPPIEYPIPFGFAVKKNTLSCHIHIHPRDHGPLLRAYFDSGGFVIGKNRTCPFRAGIRFFNLRVGCISGNCKLLSSRLYILFQ